MKKILTLCSLFALATAGVTAASIGNYSSVQSVNALSGFTGDTELDLGINVKYTGSAAGWDIAQYYINGIGDCSNGDYIAIRVKTYSVGSWFEMIPNVNGTAKRPALNGGMVSKLVSVDGSIVDSATRGWNLACNIPANFDGYYCMPKASFTAPHFGGDETLQWSSGVWAMYFLFYGTTYEPIDFDLGNIWTANVGSSLSLVNRVYDYAYIDGNSTFDTGDGTMSNLSITRAYEGMKAPAILAREVMGVDSCDRAACRTFYNDKKDAIEALSGAQDNYFKNVAVYDYASGDSAHTGGQGTRYTVGKKWNQIVETATDTSISGAHYGIANMEKDNQVFVIALVATVSIGAIAFLGLKKKRHE